MICYYKDSITLLCQIGNCFLGTLNPFQSINAVQIVFVYIENAVAVEKTAFVLLVSGPEGTVPSGPPSGPKRIVPVGLFLAIISEISFVLI